MPSRAVTLFVILPERELVPCPLEPVEQLHHVF